MNPEKVYIVDEAAKILKIERKTAYDAIARGEIPSLKIGRRLLVPKAAFDKLLDEGRPRPTVA